VGLFKLNKTKKAHVSQSAAKVMVIAFFSCCGMIYMHTISSRITVTRAYYCSVLKTLMDHIRRKWPELAGHWMLHHDNARPYDPNTVIQLLTSNGIWHISLSPPSAQPRTSTL
jgi:hypothetical protein